MICEIVMMPIHRGNTGGHEDDVPPTTSSTLDRSCTSFGQGSIFKIPRAGPDGYCFFYFGTGLGQAVAKISNSGTGIRRILKAQVNGFQAIELRRLLTASVPSRSDFWIND